MDGVAGDDELDGYTSSGQSEHCGYRLEIGLVEQAFPADPCDRPVWEDHEWCIWHAPVDGKTLDELEAADPEPGGNFNGAYLRDAALLGVDWLEDASLVGADFTGADVKGVDFTDANLTLATLTGVNALNTSFRGANLEGAILTNADLRRANLEGARLHEAVLTDVHIGGGTTMGDASVYDVEDASPDLVREQPLEAAAWVYRQFAQLYQDNGLARLARESYYREKDARRRLAWTRGNYATALRQETSRWVMRYGDSPYRILGTALAVIVVFALLYPLTGGIQEVQGERAITYTLEPPVDAPSWWVGRVLLKSLYFSVVTFTTLGYGDIQPLGPWARFLAGLEALLGAMLAALLVFVLARIVTW